MKIAGVIIKSLKEQVRSFWILLLSMAMGPFFVFVYYLIVESSKPQYDILLVNNDQGFPENGQPVNNGQSLIDYFVEARLDTLQLPFQSLQINDRETGIETLKKKQADALIIIPGTFSRDLHAKANHDSLSRMPVEFVGDLTNTNYLISAVWANELLSEFMVQASHRQKLISVKETALGASGTMDDFNMIVPGILILSLIMLMFTASIAFVSEVGN
jgi:hypothetical protein